MRLSGVSIWLKDQIFLNARIIKYGLVGCAGIAVNLGTLALIFTISSRRGWMPSAAANIVSTAGNFVLHNVWTFSDRRHQGARLVRGFLSFVVMSVAGIVITTAAYVGFTQIVTRMGNPIYHLGGLGVSLLCQFVAILLGASVSYTLNRQFTWPQTRENMPADATQAQEI